MDVFRTHLIQKWGAQECKGAWKDNSVEVKWHILLIQPKLGASRRVVTNKDYRQLRNQTIFSITAFSDSTKKGRRNNTKVILRTIF